MTGQEEEVSVTFYFTADGKVTGDMNGNTAQGTYKVEGANVSVTIDGTTLAMTLEDGKLTMEQQGVKMIMVK
jgi:hypothetical protein